jgi:hypothetical protein
MTAFTLQIPCQPDDTCFASIHLGDLMMSIAGASQVRVLLASKSNNSIEAGYWLVINGVDLGVHRVLALQPVLA